MSDQVVSKIQEQKLTTQINRMRRSGVPDNVILVRAEQDRKNRRRDRKAIIPSGDFEEIRKSRIRVDPVLQLYKVGDLSQEQFDAAEQIRSVWEAISAGRNLQAGNMEPTIRVQGPYKSPIEKLPYSLEATYRSKWIPWANEMSKNFVSIGTAKRIRIVRSMDVLIDIAAERKTFTETILKIGMRKSDGFAALKIIFLNGLNAWPSVR